MRLVRTFSRSGVKLNWFLMLVSVLSTAPTSAQETGQVGETQKIPGAARIAAGQPAALSFQQAITLAIENNLATLLVQERRNEARGVRQQSFAPLLPNFSSAVYQASLTENLVALGFRPGSVAGINSTFLGPFRNFDVRVLLTQTIFDLSAIRNYQAGKAGVRVAELQEGLAREQVASGLACCIWKRCGRNEQ
jgi:outer membrane protein TolC